ncbi:hypothetical protein RUM43_003936 [Polyplax serrata]|uniref:Uncharacterized protein n=1 Tax=Polyplax serrata TaxID=468196 RepID=A0AAN8SAD8_POLSC
MQNTLREAMEKTMTDVYFTLGWSETLPEVYFASFLIWVFRGPAFSLFSSCYTSIHRRNFFYLNNSKPRDRGLDGSLKQIQGESGVSRSFRCQSKRFNPLPFLIVDCRTLKLIFLFNLEMENTKPPPRTVFSKKKGLDFSRPVYRGGFSSLIPCV